MVIILAIPVLALETSPDVAHRITSDETLIIAGTGAEKALLGETAQAVIARRGAPLRMVTLSKNEEAFEHIFLVKTELKIPFDAIYFYGDGKGIFFLHHNTITAIAGSAKNRVTSDAVSLEKGVQHFVFHYGNDKLTQLTKGRHRAYLYLRKGIAVFDDEGNDGIDLYLVFRPSITP